MTLSDLTLIVTGMSGLGAFISILVNILKKFKVVKDNEGGTWVTGLNLLAVVLYFAGKTFFDLEFDLPALDGQLDNLASVLQGIFALMVGFGGSAVWHKQVGGVLPWLGASHSKGTVE